MTNVGPESDVYSLGHVLFRLITGRGPFEPEPREDDDWEKQHAEATPRSLDEFVDGVPSGLDDLINTMIAKERTQRYANGGKAAEALDAFLLNCEQATPGLEKPFSQPSQPKTTAPAQPLRDEQASRASKYSANERIVERCVVVAFTLMVAFIYIELLSLKTNRGGPTEEITNSIGMKLREIPAGSFKMGSPLNERGRSDDEALVDVAITKPFYMGVYEVTHEEWERVMGENPSHFKICDDKEDQRRPVERVSYEDALLFLTKLNSLDKDTLPVGWRYVLPTEAQWEYACRAKSVGAYSLRGQIALGLVNYNGSDDSFLVQDGSLKRTETVGKYLPNAWGLHDMHGNVWEWCRDDYQLVLPGGIDPFVSSKVASDRVFRGGGWSSFALRCRSAIRNKCPPDFRCYYLGFRVAACSD
ncbi:MAG: SUMF1/EgtB/PvdO family nonheme iron enzyme [Planctomycetia bacterium]